MKLRNLTLVGACLWLAMPTVQADDSWSLRLGASLRSFDEVSVQVPAGSRFNPAGGPYGVQQFTTFVGDRTVAAIHPNATELDEDAWGLALQAFKPLVVDNYVLSLGVGFQYNRLDDSSSAVTGVTTSHLVIGGSILPPSPGSVTALDPVAAGYAQSVDFEGDLFVFDLGLKAAASAGPFEFYAIGGPSVVIGKLEASYTASYPAPVVPAEPAYPGTTAGSDDSTEIGLAVYLGLGIEFAFSEQVSIGAEYRYDFGGSLDNDYGKLELESQSVSVFLTVRFH